MQGIDSAFHFGQVEFEISLIHSRRDVKHKVDCVGQELREHIEPYLEIWGSLALRVDETPWRKWVE